MPAAEAQAQCTTASLFDSILDDIAYLEDEQKEAVRRAYLFAERAHEGQYRRSGDPYIIHPVAVAKILAEMHMDHQSLMAAMMHDVVEDTDYSKQDITDAFDDTVAELVDGVTKISKIQFNSHAEAQAENFRKMLMAMTQDIRVILVKLADRLHNMRTLGVLQAHKRRRIAMETLEIYAPIANRLGMNNVRVEFEDLGFQALYPMRSQRIKKAVVASRGNRKEIITSIEDAINRCLSREGLTGRVFTREKHLFSIYRKMKAKRTAFKQIMDVYGVRIIVDSVDSCYRVLGAVHNLYKPIPGRFKDYIAIPKSNGYQSLHTTLIGHSGIPIEIQIRTEDMEAMANNGIAAHWLYKTSEDRESGAQVRAREWVKSLLDIQQQAGNSLEFIENVKIDLFPDEVYVFTPLGQILELPSGSSPIDFAYAVHTDVGNTCVAAKIDHEIHPLSTPLQNGQTVEIITASGAKPSASWLSFVVTAKARSNIRHYLKHQQHEQSVELGKRLLLKALAQHDRSLDDIPQERIDYLLQEANFEGIENLFEQIGIGNRMAQLTVLRLMSDDDSRSEHDESPLKPLAIQGTEGMVIRYARCCRPIPGDPITGYLSPGRGMVVHVSDCNNVLAEMRDTQEKCIPVRWAEQVEGEFEVDLRVELENSRGVLAVIARLLSESDTNIEAIDLQDKDARYSIARLSITIRDRQHLASTIKRLRSLSAINKITRIRN